MSNDSVSDKSVVYFCGFLPPLMHRLVRNTHEKALAFASAFFSEICSQGIGTSEIAFGSEILLRNMKCASYIWERVLFHIIHTAGAGAVDQAAPAPCFFCCEQEAYNVHYTLTIFAKLDIMEFISEWALHFFLFTMSMKLVLKTFAEWLRVISLEKRFTAA